MPADDAPEDGDVRTTYNFAPGNIGLVYRADVPDYGAGPSKGREEREGEEEGESAGAAGGSLAMKTEAGDDAAAEAEKETTHYKLQAMKWGLIPSWTKRNPDYGSVLRTINCRDDSLSEQRSGMWNNMKRRKRCIVICHGFYEWLKKNDGKDRLPHYTKRKDGQLMCFAGLWDCVQYEGILLDRLKYSRERILMMRYTGSDEKTYTFTVITTDSNKQLNFLHDRMPVILEPGSEALRTWLDPSRYEWTNELQSLLKPYKGELECYPVNKDVGKVGNNSPSFIIPIDSSENKNNIANFFGNQAKLAKAQKYSKHEDDIKTEAKSEDIEQTVPKQVKLERDAAGDVENSESNAPLPVQPPAPKRTHDKTLDDGDATTTDSPSKVPKTSQGSTAASTSTPSKPGRKVRSATSNGTVTKSSPAKAVKGSPAKGSQKITNFFGKKAS